MKAAVRVVFAPEDLARRVREAALRQAEAAREAEREWPQAFRRPLPASEIEET
ncbi:hypothetical protein [Aureimonas populi]|uniref:Uncharacterized protein n=1 Tax=Aureimonas populi TaxID=1701758 RepID=A0ABW5CIC8_9HYPH|nr:hypothetical protein [Aureimonas populi]